VEGPTDDAEILALRQRQAKNLMATLLISQGVPMLLAGDEFLRTQGGNNNAWCQDNAVSWMDWNLKAKNADFLRFVREMIVLRKAHPALRRATFFHGAGPSGKLAPDIIWHGLKPGLPDFSATSRTLAFALDGRQTATEPDNDFYVACNARAEPLSFRIPHSPSGRTWRRIVNTALKSPLDIVPADEGRKTPANSFYRVAPFAMVILMTED
jgi:glycogen operon protein